MDEKNKRLENYKKEAEELLKKVTLSEPWKNPQNQTKYVLMVDDEVVGHLKKKVDINKLTIGEAHKTWRGRKVKLMYNGEFVGILWI